MGVRGGPADGEANNYDLEKLGVTVREGNRGAWFYL